MGQLEVKVVTGVKRGSVHGSLDSMTSAFVPERIKVFLELLKKRLYMRVLLTNKLD